MCTYIEVSVVCSDLPSFGVVLSSSLNLGGCVCVCVCGVCKCACAVAVVA